MSTYGGESFAKKSVRPYSWLILTDLLRTSSPRVLALAGPHGADVGVARVVCPGARVVLVDREPEAARRAGFKVEGGDFLKMCTSGQKFDALHLDLCEQLSHRLADQVAKASAFGVVDGGVVCVAVSYGREPQSALAMRVRRHAEAMGRHHLSAGTSGKLLARRVALNVLIAEAFVRRGLLAWSIGVSIGYQSRTDSKVGTPMMMAYYRVARTSRVKGTKLQRLATPGFVLLDDGPFGFREQPTEPMVERSGEELVLWGKGAELKACAVYAARALGPAVASDLFCVPRAQLAAWLAWDTRRPMELSVDARNECDRLVAVALTRRAA